jgi:hypothetical protein
MVILLARLFIKMPLAGQSEDIVVEHDRQIFGFDPRQLGLDHDFIFTFQDAAASSS